MTNNSINPEQPQATPSNPKQTPSDSKPPWGFISLFYITDYLVPCSSSSAIEICSETSAEWFMRRLPVSKYFSKKSS